MDNVEIQLIADKIKARHLRVPAILFLEMHKPLANLAKEAFAMSAPLIRFIFSGSGAKKTSELLNDPDALETLIKHLEAN